MSDATKPEGLYSGYGGGEEMPLGGYAVLLAAYTAAAGIALATLGRKLPERLSPQDLLLTGVATHKLTRIVTKDWVTSPLRVPFTVYKRSLGGGEVEEEARGRGVRRAVGDLLTCPFCFGPWAAGAFAIGWTAAPRFTRMVASLFTATAVSDFLHQAYARLKG